MTMARVVSRVRLLRDRKRKRQKNLCRAARMIMPRMMETMVTASKVHVAIARRAKETLIRIRPLDGQFDTVLNHSTRRKPG